MTFLKRIEWQKLISCWSISNDLFLNVSLKSFQWFMRQFASTDKPTHAHTQTQAKTVWIQAKTTLPFSFWWRATKIKSERTSGGRRESSRLTDAVSWWTAWVQHSKHTKRWQPQWGFSLSHFCLPQFGFSHPGNTTRASLRIVWSFHYHRGFKPQVFQSASKNVTVKEVIKSFSRRRGQLSSVFSQWGWVAPTFEKL